MVLPALLVSLAIFAAAAAGAAATASFWLPKVKGLLAAPDPRIAGLEARVKALEERPPAPAPASIAAAAPAPVAGPVPAPAPALTPAPIVDKAALDELVRRLGESEAGAAELARRLAMIESAEAKTARTDPAAPALVLAVGQLRDAGAAGRPFVRELESLRALAQGRREVAEAAERLAALAAKGVPTVSMLRERFDGAARAVTIAARAEGDGTWIDRMLARLSTLVAVRRTDDRAAEGTPDAALRAAEQALGQGDVANAAAALAKLAGPAEAAARG
ncbi:MAG: mitofilin family membrane protein, partial [Pseudomonadota bacterium]